MTELHDVSVPKDFDPIKVLLYVEFFIAAYLSLNDKIGTQEIAILNEVRKLLDQSIDNLSILSEE